MTKKVIETANGWYMKNDKEPVELDDIVGLVKTDEPTNSVQLKKEAQLCICEKRLIELEKENEQLKKEVEMLRNGLKAYDEALPLYLDCEDIMHFNNSELFEFKMEQMDFYKKYPNRVHYK